MSAVAGELRLQSDHLVRIVPAISRVVLVDLCNSLRAILQLPVFGNLSLVRPD